MTKLWAKFGIGSKPSGRCAPADKWPLIPSAYKACFRCVKRFPWLTLALVESRTYFSGLSYSRLPLLTGSVLSRRCYRGLFGCGSVPPFDCGENGMQPRAHWISKRCLSMPLWHFFFIFFEAVPYFTLWSGTNKQPHELLQMEVHRAFAVNVLMLYAMVLFRDDEHALKKIFCLNFEEYVWLIVQSYFRVKALILEEWAKRCSAYNGALD